MHLSQEVCYGINVSSKRNDSFIVDANNHLAEFHIGSDQERYRDALSIAAENVCQPRSNHESLNGMIIPDITFASHGAFWAV